MIQAIMCVCVSVCAPNLQNVTQKVRLSFQYLQSSSIELRNIITAERNYRKKVYEKLISKIIEYLAQEKKVKTNNRVGQCH